MVHEPSHTPRPDRRDYPLGIEAEFSSILYPISFGLLLLFVIGFPLWQLARGEAVFWEILYALGPLAVFGYFFLRAADKVSLFADGTVRFHYRFGSRVVSLGEIERIRPYFWLAKNDFVLVHSRGRELLFGDPVTVSYLVRELAARNSGIHLVRVPNPPGGRA